MHIELLDQGDYRKKEWTERNRPRIFQRFLTTSSCRTVLEADWAFWQQIDYTGLLGIILNKSRWWNYWWWKIIGFLHFKSCFLSVLWTKPMRNCASINLTLLNRCSCSLQELREMIPIKVNFACNLLVTLGYFTGSSASYNPHRAGTDVNLCHYNQNYFFLSWKC